MLGQILVNTWTLFLEAAPWLLLGLLVAGLIKAWVPERRMGDWLGGSGLWPATKAALVGAPLPLCSCGVIPAALGLHRAGASRASTTAFLIATPETGADSVGISYALLGPFFTVLRPVTAVASGVLTGLLSGLAPAGRRRRDAACATAGCGGDDCADAGPAPAAEACCDDECATAASVAEAAGRQPPSWWRRTRGGLHYAVTEVLDDFSLWLGIGLVAAGIAITLVPPSALADYGSGITAMLAMVVIGIPVYVCATESTPIAAAMLLAGVSPGTVLVFLLAGPATNLGTVGALHKEFGWRFVLVYVAGISTCAVGFGLLTDALVGWLGIDISAQLQAGSQLLPHWLSLACALLLAVLALPVLRGPLLRRLV